MAFTDILNSPLPSKQRKTAEFVEGVTPEEYLSQLENTLFEEGFDADGNYIGGTLGDEEDKYGKEGCSKEGCSKEGCSGAKCEGDDEFGTEGCSKEGCSGAKCEGDDDDDLDLDDIEDDDDDEDNDDLDDDDLLNLDKELRDDDNTEIDDEDDDDDDDDDDEDEVDLTPDEELKADDMMSLAATTMLVNDELNDDEKKEFAESDNDMRIAVNEGFMTESDVNDLRAVVSDVYTEGKNYNKKMIIRLDKDAKMKQLRALGIRVSAAAHRDSDYMMYKKATRIKRAKWKKLEKKYGREGEKRAKIYFNRLRNSKSNVLSSVAKKIEK